MKHINLSSPLAPLQGEIGMCIHWLFCMKLNAKQLLFKVFFDIMRIFGSVQPWSESPFPFQYNIILETCQYFKPRSFTPGRDRHMRSPTFLYQIQFSTNFIWTIFWYNWLFGQYSARKWIYFHISVQYNVQRCPRIIINKWKFWSVTPIFFQFYNLQHHYIVYVKYHSCT